MSSARDRDAGDAGDAELLARLRDLAVVEIDALVWGVPAARRQALIAAFADDAADALARARARVATLTAVLSGPDPLAVAEVPAAARARDGGRRAIAEARAGLAARRRAAIGIARLCAGADRVVERLVEADRRRSG